MTSIPATSQVSQARRLTTLFSLLAAFSSSFWLFSYVTADPDLWGHLKFGLDSWAAGRLADTDPYSFTALGNTWINHEWLAEISFALAYLALGSPGLILGKLLLGFVLVALMWMACRTRAGEPLAFALVMMPAAATVAPGFMVRPQLFSFVFFALFVLLLHEKLTQGKDRLFLLPLLTVLWINLHGGVLMGLALVFVAACWQTFSRIVFRGKDTGLGSLWLWFSASCLATLANPYGVRLLVFLYETVTLSRDITEWEPVPLWENSFLDLKLLIALFLILLVLRRKSVRGWEVMGIAMTLVAALKHQRHMPFFAIAAAPFLVAGLSALGARIREKSPKFALTAVSWHALTVALAILFGYQVAMGAAVYRSSRMQVIVDPRVYPVRAVRFMNENKIHGNLVVPFDWGEYALWHLYPRSLVSMDGRFDTSYPAGVIEDHFQAQAGPGAWMDLLAKYPGATVSMAPRLPGWKELILSRAPVSGWVLVYEDHNSLILLRDCEGNAGALARHGSRGFQPPGKVSWFFP